MPRQRTAGKVRRRVITCVCRLSLPGACTGAQSTPARALRKVDDRIAFGRRADGGSRHRTMLCRRADGGSRHRTMLCLCVGESVRAVVVGERRGLTLHPFTGVWALTGLEGHLRPLQLLCPVWAQELEWAKMYVQAGNEAAAWFGMRAWGGGALS